MAASRKPDAALVRELLERLVALDVSQRPSIRAAARNLGTNQFTLERYLNEYGPHYGLVVKRPFKASAKLVVSEDKATRSREAELEREIKTLKVIASEERQHRMKVEKELIVATRLKEYLFGITKAPLTIPKWTVKPAGKKASDHIPVLFASDFQWGEVISAGNMGGLNEFNKAVAETRYNLLIDRTIDIATSHLPRNKYAGLIYLRGGDMISGEIHDDLAQSNDLKAIPAVRSLVAAEYRGLKMLADTFGHIYVVSVPGNHGRTTRKPQSKAGAINNFDTLSAWWLESMFIDDPRVTFYTPESGDALIGIFGEDYLLTHGDRIGSRGGEGFVGPAATITRGMKRTHDLYAKIGRPISSMFVGHFHVAMELEYGWSNGSLPGYSEYARDGRMTPAPPEQWLIFFHPRYGATSRWPILLEPKPHLAADQRVDPFVVKPALEIK